MEPAGFFVMSTFSLLGQMYFLMHSTEYSNEDLQTRIYHWFLAGIYRRAEFDLPAYQALKERIDRAAPE